MEIPAPWAGVVTEINIALGDKIKQGDVLLALQTEEDSVATSEESIAEVINTEPKIIPVMVPDIGDFDEVEVIEVLVNAGDELSAEDSIITLESDKASMEIPTPVAGKVIDINVTLGDKIKLGDLILNIENTAVKTPKKKRQPQQFLHQYSRPHQKQPRHSHQRHKP
ncbi:Dihydrolipoamide acetyltransferase component of pyruvate dehydrogenase complex (EC [uncultured Gammaproteobacteria bacterium]|nr:Dihydrolipoamide acetyltransferase component of pyruvate dehydrogenase complex (EC [uncultured Gammaproteobacteria bacterium]